MKDVNFFAGLVFLAICCSKAVSGDTTDIKYSLYGLNRTSQDLITMETLPGKEEFEYMIKGDGGRVKTIKNVALLTKERIDTALTLFLSKIREQQGLKSIIIGGTFEDDRSLTGLIPDKKILKESYFDVMPTLEYIKIIVENIAEGLVICRNGNIKEFREYQNLLPRPPCRVEIPLRINFWEE